MKQLRVVPGKTGRETYALLFDALKKTGYVGVAKIAMHNRKAIAIATRQQADNSN